MSLPFMWSTFCDDVRQEVGNKLSYLGVYGPNLIVPSFPTALVKLCCIMSVRVPAQSAPPGVTFRMLRGEEVIFEAEVLQAEMEELALPAPSEGLDTHALTISTVAQLISFQITQHCHVRTVAIVDGTELHGGALELVATNSSRGSMR